SGVVSRSHGGTTTRGRRSRPYIVASSWCRGSGGCGTISRRSGRRCSEIVPRDRLRLSDFSVGGHRLKSGPVELRLRLKSFLRGRNNQPAVAILTLCPFDQIIFQCNLFL